MKKTILLLIIFTLSLPLAFALIGGQTWNYHFDECSELRVNITGNLTIDKGEYTIHNECIETEDNYFICNCSDNFDFNISFKINAINDYNFAFNYDYTKEVADEPSPRSRSSGGSGGGGSLYYVCTLKQSINNTYCRETFCPTYLDRMDCLKSPTSNHLCCITYFEQEEEDTEVDDIVDVEPSPTVDIIDEAVIIPTEEPKKSNRLRNTIIIISAFLLVLLFLIISLFIYLGNKNHKEVSKNE